MVFAGGGAYVGDGRVATAAVLHSPEGLALDAAGNLYIADSAGNIIRRVSASDGTISTIAGVVNSVYAPSQQEGSDAAQAVVGFPLDVAFDPAGNLYIADEVNDRIWRIDSAGKITTYAGGGSPADGVGDNGPATAANIIPWGIAFDRAGNLFIADNDPNSTIPRAHPPGRRGHEEHLDDRRKRQGRLCRGWRTGHSGATRPAIRRRDRQQREPAHQRKRQRHDPARRWQRNHHHHRRQPDPERRRSARRRRAGPCGAPNAAAHGSQSHDRRHLRRRPQQPSHPQNRRTKRDPHRGGIGSVLLRGRIRRGQRAGDCGQAQLRLRRHLRHRHRRGGRCVPLRFAEQPRSGGVRLRFRRRAATHRGIRRSGSSAPGVELRRRRVPLRRAPRYRFAARARDRSGPDRDLVFTRQPAAGDEVLLERHREGRFVCPTPSTATSAVSSFTTATGCGAGAFDTIAPADGAQNVDAPTLRLSWQPPRERHYDVYFGPTNPPPLLASGIQQTSTRPWPSLTPTGSSWHTPRAIRLGRRRRRSGRSTRTSPAVAHPFRRSRSHRPRRAHRMFRPASTCNGRSAAAMSTRSTSTSGLPATRHCSAATWPAMRALFRFRSSRPARRTTGASSRAQRLLRRRNGDHAGLLVHDARRLHDARGDDDPLRAGHRLRGSHVHDRLVARFPVSMRTAAISSSDRLQRPSTQSWTRR